MIIKKVKTQFGVDAEIWKLGYISLDRVSKYGSITMNLYFTEDAEQYIDSKTQLIPEDKFDEYFESGGDIFENCERFMLENCDLFMEDGATHLNVY